VGEKKAQQVSAEIEAYYSAYFEEHTTCCGGISTPEAISLENWSKTIDQIAKDLHTGKIKATDLNKDYILKVLKEILLIQTKAKKQNKLQNG